MEFVADTFGDLVGGWKPVNETNYYANAAYGGRGWPPGRRDKAERAVAAENIHLATAEAAVALRATGAPVASVFGLSCEVALDDRPETAATVAALQAVNWNAGIGLHRDGVLRVPGRPPVERPDLAGCFDFLGFSYYATIGVAEGRVVPYPVDATLSPLGYGIDAAGLDLVLSRLHEQVPGTPLLVAEFGLGTDDDALRSQYLTEGVRIVHDAVSRGIDVRGFFHWTAVDNYEWQHGFDVAFGLLDLDRNVRPSAEVLRREATWVNGAWPIGPFAEGGEILGPHPELTFECPASGRSVAWAAKDVFNPAAIVRNGTMHLLVRAEDHIGPFAGTSRIGLAVSSDGVEFSLHPEPVLFPDGGPWRPWEWPGGCEDPRVVESPDGGYVCCYSAFDGKASCLMVASSDDLLHWEKHGPAFIDTPFARRWSKSGSIVTTVEDGRLIAARIDGRFHMYWGEGTAFLATSDDLVRWDPVQFDAGADRYVTYDPGGGTGSWDIHRVPGHRALRPALVPRPTRFDSLLVEPGPPAVLTDQGIVLIYNGAALRVENGRVVGVTYRPGQALFDPCEPGSPIARCTEPFAVGGTGALTGQVDQVCFAEGLALFNEKWFLYYGMADSRIGYATAVTSTSR